MNQISAMSFVAMISMFILMFSQHIHCAVDPTLPPPVNVTNETPNQRLFATIVWEDPIGQTYDSYILYYRKTQDPTFRTIPNLDDQQYVLSFYSNMYIMAGTSYVIAVSGVLDDGRESPMSAPVAADRSVLAPADPKFNHTLGISNVGCGISTRRNIICSWNAGSVPTIRVNIRAKCILASGRLKILRRISIGTGTFYEIFSTPGSSTCKVQVHPLYQSPPNLRDRYGQKLRFVLNTPSKPSQNF